MKKLLVRVDDIYPVCNPLWDYIGEVEDAGSDFTIELPNHEAAMMREVFTQYAEYQDRLYYEWRRIRTRKIQEAKVASYQTNEECDAE